MAAEVGSGKISPKENKANLLDNRKISPRSKRT